MVASVGAANGRGVHSSLSSSSKVIHTTESTGAGVVTSHCLEVQPQLTHIITDLVDSVGACARTAGGVRAGVAGIPDVGGVGGDDAATGGAVDDAADTKASSTVSIRAASLGCALGAGVTRAIGGGGAGRSALLVRELDDGEQGEAL